MAINSGILPGIFQTYYPREEIPFQLPEDTPLINYVMNGKTDGGVSGLITEMPWMLSPANNASQSFGVAQQGSNAAPRIIKPTIRLSQMYKMVDISDKDQKLSQGEAAYQELMETIMKTARIDFLNNLDQLLHFGGSGVRATVVSSATVGANTRIVLDTLATETLFELGDNVVITTNIPVDGSTVNIGAGPAAVISIEQNAITVAGVLTVSAGNGVAKNGDTLGFNSAMSDPAVVGVDSYNPVEQITNADMFLGFSRFAHINRATGYRVDGRQLSQETAWKRLAMVMRLGGNTGGGAVCMGNPINVDALENKLASYQRITQSKVGEFFFESIALNSALGRLEVVSDPHQKPGIGRAYLPGALELQYRDALPHLATLETGLTQEFGQNFDGRSIRMRAYVQQIAVKPWRLGNVKLGTVN